MTFEEAVNRGLADEVKRMVESDDSIDGKCKNQGLVWAIMAEHPDIVSILLEHGADPNHWVDECSNPLHIAAEFSNPQIVEELIRYGADVNALDVVGSSVLVRSIDSEGDAGIQLDIPPKSDVTRILLDAGADPLLPCVDGTTPMDVARHLFHPEAERLLKERIKSLSQS